MAFDKNNYLMNQIRNMNKLPNSSQQIQDFLAFINAKNRTNEVMTSGGKVLMTPKEERAYFAGLPISKEAAGIFPGGGFLGKISKLKNFSRFDKGTKFAKQAKAAKLSTAARSARAKAGIKTSKALIDKITKSVKSAEATNITKVARAAEIAKHKAIRPINKMFKLPANIPSKIAVGLGLSAPIAMAIKGQLESKEKRIKADELINSIPKDNFRSIAVDYIDNTNLYPDIENTQDYRNRVNPVNYSEPQSQNDYYTERDAEKKRLFQEELQNARMQVDGLIPRTD